LSSGFKTIGPRFESRL